jgi:hypothetical protein
VSLALAAYITPQRGYVARSTSEEKRAAIIAKQQERESAEREARVASGEAPRRATGGKLRTNWAASAPFSGQRRGRPPKT